MRNAGAMEPAELSRQGRRAQGLTSALEQETVEVDRDGLPVSLEVSQVPGVRKEGA